MRRQKNKRFIWIIVDDGSTDNLESLVSEWIVDESEFQIEYYRKENGGMYTAYNLAFEHIITDYWMCIDSDDWLADDAVDRIYDAIDYVEKKKLYPDCKDQPFRQNHSVLNFLLDRNG